MGFEEALNATTDHVFVLEDARLAGAGYDAVDGVADERHVFLDNACELVIKRFSLLAFLEFELDFGFRFILWRNKRQQKAASSMLLSRFGRYLKRPCQYVFRVGALL
jgi:hypothetical protein